MHGHGHALGPVLSQQAIVPVVAHATVPQGRDGLHQVMPSVG